MPNPLVDKLSAVITPAIVAAGYELVDLQYRCEQSGWVLRLYMDGPAGITHEDCERVSREVSALLDVEDIIRQAYHLEVSSPGAERPLRAAEHFQRFTGRRARVRLAKGLEGRRNFTGTLLGVESGTVRIEVDGKEYALPLSDLEKASLVFEWSKECNNRT